MLVGVLALQGAFLEHQNLLAKCGADSRQIRKANELEGIDALIIPGGESTTIVKLLNSFALMAPIRNLSRQGLPIFGTCAGMILLAKKLVDSEQETLSLMDIEVERNAYGRQIDSFESNLSIPALGPDPFRGVFIRAPYITKVGNGVNILAYQEEQIICASQGSLLVAAFHPELTNDLRMHRYFLEQIVSKSRMLTNI